MPIPPSIESESGFDREKVIEQLIEVDRKPIYRINREIEANKSKIVAWEGLRERAKRLEELSGKLYSFNSPFRKRLVLSSDPSVITGAAKANSTPLTQNWQVFQLANDHEIRSDALNQDTQQIPRGNFGITVNKKTKNFSYPGGSLADFYQFLQNNQGEFYEIEKTVDGSQSYIRIKSKTPGASGRMHFGDPDQILASAGLVEKARKVEDLVLSPEKLNASGEKNDALKFDNQNKEKIRLTKGKFIYRIDDEIKYHLGPQQNQQSPAVTFSAQMKALEILTQTKTDKEETDFQTKKEGQVEYEQGGQVGPEIEVDVEGELFFQAGNLSRKKIRVPDNGSGLPGADREVARVVVKFITDNGDAPAISQHLLDVGKKNQDINIPLSQMPDRIQFSTEDDVELSAMQFDFGVGNRPKHELGDPRDSRIKVDKIELRRAKNKKIDDIIPNAEIDIHKKSAQAVEVRVGYDNEAVKEGVEGWVKAYNEVLTYLRKAGHSPISDINKLGDDNPGLLLGETSARTLQYSLQTIVAEAYPPYSKKGFRTLPAVGIHSGKPGADFSSVKEALLKIEKDKLAQVLVNNPKELSHLFASKSKKSRSIDNGVAFRMKRYLKPYNQQNNGIIENQIVALQDRNSRSKQSKLSLEQSLERKEENLRRDFSRMEQALRKSKETRKYLDQQSRKRNFSQ